MAARTLPPRRRIGIGQGSRPTSRAVVDWRISLFFPKHMRRFLDARHDGTIHVTPSRRPATVSKAQGRPSFRDGVSRKERFKSFLNNEPVDDLVHRRERLLGLHSLQIEGSSEVP